MVSLFSSGIPRQGTLKYATERARIIRVLTEIHEIPWEASDKPVPIISSSALYWASWRSSATEVYVKYLRYATIIESDIHMTPGDKRRELKRIMNRMRKRESLKHPNILPSLAYWWGDTLVLISSRHKNGNISQYLKAHSDADRLELLVQVASGLGFLHSESIVHGSIMPTNVIIADDGHPMLMDFGVAPDLRMVERNIAMTDSGRQNVGYMSPELIEEGSYTEASDVYAFASLLLEILSGRPPYYKCCCIQAMIHIIQRKKPSPNDHQDLSSSSPIWGLMQRCWRTLPGDRPKIEEVYNSLVHVVKETRSGTLDPQPPQQSTSTEQVDSVDDSMLQPGVQLNELPPPLKGELTPGDRIGWGGYSEIRKGTLNCPGKSTPVCIKYLQPRNPSSGGRLSQERFNTRVRRETVIWKRAQHKNILQFIGYQIDQGMPMLVSPWCENGNLRVYIKAHPELTKYDKLGLLRDAAQGLKYLHSLKPSIIHGDIKPDNVMITEEIRAVLADFGVSRLMVDLGVCTGLSTTGGAWGPPGYRAIELMQADNARPTDKSDVYSFGGLILAALTGKSPFWKIRTDAVIVTTVVRGIIPKPEDHPELPPTDSSWNLMRRCWNPNPNQRPCMKEIIDELEP